MKQSEKFLPAFLVNNSLLLSGIAMIISGFVLQLGFHIDSANRHHETTLHSQTINIEQLREINQGLTVWGVNYVSWSAIHKVTIVLFLLFMIYHFIVHWRWYKEVFTRHLVRRNKQVITLSSLFVMVVLTGLIPWFIDLSGTRNLFRLFLIEIHDKLAILLTVYLFLHIQGRVRWFLNTYNRMKK
ncbi:MAG TPA: hypothetical protein PLR88_01755 [Bacteroidales bacterium]|nr:hypothetical protein [Bacteroidales bacterium]